MTVKPSMQKYIDAGSDQRVENNVVRHEYRVLNDLEKEHMKKLKDMGLEFIKYIDSCHPESHGREMALAKTKIEEAVMWAVKGITK